MKRCGSDDPTPTARSTEITDARLVPVCRAVPSRRIAFGGPVLLIALSLTAVLLRHWQRKIEERRVRARLSELDDHLLKDIGLTRTDVRFGNVTTLAAAPIASLEDATLPFIESVTGLQLQTR